MANPFLMAALEYQAMGFHPIPCMPREKRPLVPWKEFQQVMPTTEQLHTWWRETPDANVAIVLGRGRFAVDLDGGDEAEELLAEQGIALPSDAPRSRTGGGYHVFLSSFNAIPDRVGLLTRDGGKPQVDIRGIGIVVAPPSVHPNGRRYEWIAPLVEKPPRAPAALTDLIGKATARPTAAALSDPASAGNRFWVVDALRGVGSGQRDAMCTRLAGFFITKGIDPDTTTALLCDSFARACDPPFPAVDVEKCVRSIARKHALTGDAERAVPAKHVREVLAEFSAALQAGAAPTLPTPFPSLNHYLDGGFSPSHLIFLGARPGVGKTAFALEVARFAARRRAGAVVVISREMKNLALARRLLAQDANVRASSIKRASLTETDRWYLQKSIEQLGTVPLYFTDEAVSLAEITEVCAAVSETEPLALVIVDYLQLIRAPQDIKERRHQVEAVSKGVKAIAMEHQVPVLCLSSLSRPAHEDKNKPPPLASLRESGELEHDADVILLLHRDYREEATTCYVAKNRDGRLGTVPLVFRHEYVAFEEAERKAEDERFPEMH
jgi:KaiC/GvpD/RAD55 family RecA-like ATPase